MTISSRHISAVCAALSALMIFPAAAQSHSSTQAHQKPVTDLSYTEAPDKAVFSAGQDGVLIKWTEDGLGEHYQVSDLPVKLIAHSPDRSEIAVYETDGASLNRVSIWNWKTLTRKYAFRFTDSITSLAYSAKGTYVICGTASVSGTFFLNAANGSIDRKKLKENTGVVSYIQTSETENSAVMYAPKGQLTYYNLRNGEKKASLRTEYDLDQFCMFNNSVFAAGVRGETLFVIQAVTGSTVGSFTVRNPVLAASNSAKDLFYIENDNRQFQLYKIANDRNKAVAAPELIRTFAGLKSGEKIICAAVAGTEIYAGTSAGNIYSFDYSVSERVDTLLALSDDMYDRIYDIAAVDDDFYFLTPNSIFKSSYDNGIVDRKGANSGYTNLIPSGENVILWSKDSKKPVVLLELATGAEKKLFVPAGSVQVLKLYGDTLICIEANSSVSSFSITTMEKRQLYKGTSIQDAILYNANDLYVAKSSGTTPNVPLIYVNVTTQETVPLSLKGNVAYSLSYDYTKPQSDIYGVSIYTDQTSKKRTTAIFSYKPATKTSRNLLSISDEDSEAFVYLANQVLYTNIGKNQVRSYNLSTRRDFLYKRSASMPLKAVVNNNRVVVLNRDGSISWYNAGLGTVLADWYLTVDGNWFEF